MKLAEIFSKIPDFRVVNRSDHKLCDILVISLCAVISGAEDFEEIAEYGNQKEEFLGSFLELPNGIPSHDTFNRVFRFLDKAAYQQVLVNWSTEIISQLQELEGDRTKLINIDGKVLRATGKRGKKTAALCLVSAWVSEHCLSLGQVKVNKKSNEKTAIPELIEAIDIEGAMVSIDAMGCHASIAELIIQNKGDYLLALKKNQKSLYEEVHDWMMNRKSTLEQYTDIDYVGGRIEKRTAFVTQNIQFIDTLENWPNCKSIIMVECERQFKNGIQKTTHQTKFYVSSAVKIAQDFQTYTRNHWSIENQLHWYLDVVFQEDRQRVRMDNAPDNMAITRKMALQLLLDNKGNSSLKKVRKRAGWNDDFLLEVLQSIPIQF